MNDNLPYGQFSPAPADLANLLATDLPVLDISTRILPSLD